MLWGRAGGLKDAVCDAMVVASDSLWSERFAGFIVGRSRGGVGINRLLSLVYFIPPSFSIHRGDRVWRWHWLHVSSRMRALSS